MDKIIFDVGHQSYAQKILTAQRSVLYAPQEKRHLRFPKRDESEHDPFNTGHASTAISAALALRARKNSAARKASPSRWSGRRATGGLAFEGLNDAGQADVPLIVIHNDNEMSISPNVGALHRMLVNMRSSEQYVRLNAPSFACWIRHTAAGFRGTWKTLKTASRAFSCRTSV